MIKSNDYDLSRFEDYFRFLQETNERGSSSFPMLIEADPEKIRDIQKAVFSSRKLQYLDTDDLRVGILASDPYLGMLIRDAVVRETGEVCLYNRVVTPGGVCVLPILAESIVLIKIFRHSIRGWSVEAIQGHIDSASMDVETIVANEVMEEIGSNSFELTSLGRLYTSTPLSSENLHLYSCHINEIGAIAASEGISSAIVIPFNEILYSVKSGLISDGPTIGLIMRALSMGVITL